MDQYEERSKTALWLKIPKSSLTACRKFLFENGVTLQEFICQLVAMVENKDPVVKILLESAKKNRFANNKKEYVFTNSKSIYAALERKEILKDRE